MCHLNVLQPLNYGKICSGPTTYKQSVAFQSQRIEHMALCSEVFSVLLQWTDCLWDICQSAERVFRPSASHDDTGPCVLPFFLPTSPLKGQEHQKPQHLPEWVVAAGQIGWVWWEGRQLLVHSSSRYWNDPDPEVCSLHGALFPPQLQPGILSACYKWQLEVKLAQDKGGEDEMLWPRNNLPLNLPRVMGRAVGVDPFTVRWRA